MGLASYDSVPVCSDGGKLNTERDPLSSLEHKNVHSYVCVQNRDVNPHVSRHKPTSEWQVLGMGIIHYGLVVPELFIIVSLATFSAASFTVKARYWTRRTISMI